jgi:hypothetical protein
MIASFEDGSPAVTVNKYGKGATIVVVPDAPTAARHMPQMIRDVFDYALSLRGGLLPVDINGTDETTDIAVEQTKDGFRVALVNHNAGELPVVLRPNKTANAPSLWIDLMNEATLGAAVDGSLKMTVAARGFRAVEFRRTK